MDHNLFILSIGVILNFSIIFMFAQYDQNTYQHSTNCNNLETRDNFLQKQSSNDNIFFFERLEVFSIIDKNLQGTYEKLHYYIFQQIHIMLLKYGYRGHLTMLNFAKTNFQTTEKKNIFFNFVQKYLSLLNFIYGVCSNCRALLTYSLPNLT